MSKVATDPEVLLSHANARLTVHGRLLLDSRVPSGRPVSHVAKELGLSRQGVHRWMNRYRELGQAGLADRSSSPRSCPSQTTTATEAAVVAARRELRCGPAGISAATGVPARTISRILERHGVAPLVCCDPLTGEVIRAHRQSAIRYERDRPGELVHIDVKKLGAFLTGAAGAPWAGN